MAGRPSCRAVPRSCRFTRAFRHPLRRGRTGQDPLRGLPPHPGRSFDLVEFPPLDTDDEEEEFGRLVATRDGPLAALTAAEDVTGAVRGRWVNASVDLPRPTTVALRCGTQYRGGATDVISVGFPAAVLSRVYGGIFWAPSEPGTSSAHRALPATPGFPVGPAQYGRSGIPSPGRHRGPAGRGRGGGRGAPDVA